jgi:hypothetical protein
MGNDPRDQKGGTTVTSTPINDAAAETRIGMEQARAIDEERMAEGQAHNQNLRAHQNAMLAKNNIFTPNADISNDIERHKQLLRDPADTTRQLYTQTDAATKALYDAMGVPQPQAQAPATPIPMQPGAVAPAAPTTPATPPDKAGSRNRVQEGVSTNDAGTITVTDKRGALEASNDQYAQTTQTVKAERMDEIKTSLTNLQRLAAFEDTLHGIGNMNGYESGIKKNVYSDLATQRQADLARWEKDAMLEGTQTKTEKIGTSTTKLGASEASSTVTSKEAMKTGTTVTTALNTGSGRDKDDKATYTIGHAKFSRGTDYDLDSNNQIVFRPGKLTKNDVADDFRDGSGNMRLTTAPDGKAGIIDTVKELVDPTTSPEAAGSMMEVIDNNNVIWEFKSPDGKSTPRWRKKGDKKFLTDDKEPFTGAKQTKIYDGNGDTVLNATPSIFSNPKSTKGYWVDKFTRSNRGFGVGVTGGGQ